MPAANPPGRNVPPAPKPVDAADRWSEMRRGMPVCRRFAYFDHAAVAPLPEVTCIAMRSYLEEAADGGDVHWTKWTRRVEAIRETAARGLGASPTEIAFAANTTTGIHWVAEGFPWRAGDNVVLPANEFPSNAFPWQNLARRDVEARRVPEPADG